MRFLLPLLLAACGPDVSTPEAFGEAYLEGYCAVEVGCATNGYTMDECLGDYGPNVRAAYTTEGCPGYDPQIAADCVADLADYDYDSACPDKPASCDVTCHG